MPPRVAVLGGGITGLAAAFHLQRSSPGTEVRLFEASSRFGGVIRTEKVSGFLLDLGPDSIFAEKPLDLVAELSLERDLVPIRSWKDPVRILFRGRLRALPAGSGLGAPGSVLSFLRNDLLSPLGKARALLEPLVPPRRKGSDESIGSFARKRFGREFAERVASPLLAGIHAGEASRLSLRSTFPRLAKMEEAGSLLRAARRRAPGPSAPRFFSFREGMETLPRAIVSSLDPRVLAPRKEIVALERAGGRYRLRMREGDSWEADACVVALPARFAAPLLRPLDGQAGELLGSLRSVSTAVVFLAFPKEKVSHPLDATGFLVPSGEGRSLFACTFVSSKFEGRAPEGKVLLRAFLVGAREGTDDLPEEALVRTAREELKEILGVEAEPLLVRVERYASANPQYEVGHSNAVERLDARLSLVPGLFVAGSACRGIGIPDCVASGREAAAAAGAFVRELPRD